MPNNISANQIITLGSDPELAFVTPQGQVVNANDLYQPDNPTGIDTLFGYDGHSATGEIRPRPATDAKGAIKAVEKILRQSKNKYPKAYQYNMMSTSHRLSLGGHIHFGHEKLTPQYRFYESLTRQLVTNLDNLLAFPVMFLEDREDGKWRRLSNSYGKLSDYRHQNWGFEYRTLSSWISNKELTSYVFYVAHAIADATINHKFSCTPITNKDGFDYCFNGQAREVLKPHLDSIFEQEKSLYLYKNNDEYKKQIEKFMEAVRKETPLFNTEIKEGWKIDFDITDFWNVERLETLLEKIAKCLVAIHTERGTYRKLQYRFATGSYKDTACPEISKNVNTAMNHLLDPEVLKSQAWKKIRVFGLKQTRGNEVWLGKTNLEEKRRKQLLSLLWDIASNFQHKTKIEKIVFKKDAPSFAIGFGKEMRTENLVLAEAMVVLTLLFVNKDLFKHKEKKGKKTTQLYITKHKVLEPIIKNLMKVKELVIKPFIYSNPKLNNVEFPSGFDLRKSTYEIAEDLRQLDDIERHELSNAMARVLARLKPIVHTTCIANCSQSRETRIDTLCPQHMANAVFNICDNSLPNPDNTDWWRVRNEMGIETRHCNECDNNIPTSEFCDRCEYCNNCCECRTCGHCDERVHEDDFCTDCDRCNDCCDCTHCEHCGDTVDSVCELCDNCDECCRCPICSECDQRFEELCDECNRCDEHCTCNNEEETTTPATPATPAVTTTPAEVTQTLEQQQANAIEENGGGIVEGAEELNEGSIS